MGAFAGNYEFANNAGVTSDELILMIELLCALFLKIISEGDSNKFNYLVTNMQQVAEKPHETFLEIHGNEGGQIH